MVAAMIRPPFSTVSIFLCCFALALTGMPSGMALAQEKDSKAAKPSRSAHPHLVVQITIDQLRSEAFQSMAPHFTGGLAYLRDKGIIFRNAHYLHSTTFTATGHATLFTGGNPAQHGIVGNGWFDQAKRSDVYCVDDLEHRILNGNRLKTTSATSPKNLLSTTTGDELILASGSKSRVFSVAGKDRSAIISGGKLGKAFWYNPESGEMVTSSFYGSGYPNWVKPFNKANRAAGFQKKQWTLIADPAVYRFDDDRESEMGVGGLGKTFPHPLQPVAKATGAKFPGVFRFTPYLDELVASFATELVEKESLGSSDSGATDFLALAFSSVDYIGHAWGPLSREYEDALLRLDLVLGDFFKMIDAKVGLGNTLFVLCSDHGASPAPEAMSAQGYPAGRVDFEELIKSCNQGLQKQFGLAESDNIVVRFTNPSLYFDLKLIEKHKLNPKEVENAVSEMALSFPGIAHAFSRNQLMWDSTSENQFFAMARRSFHPKRSGDVIIIQEPFWYLYKDRTKYAGMHGSPYPYDTHVPIVFAGLGLKGQSVMREVAPRDIAPTVCRILGITSPTGCVGSVLTEVFE